jgi:hypothetical protein
MSQESNNTIHQCLHAVWQRTQRRHAAGAALAFARWFIPLALGVILIDRLAYLPGWLRAVAALAVLAVALIQAWRQGGSRLRRFDAMQAAQQIEDSQSGLDSLLFTALQFQQQGATPGTSAAMWELAQRRADEAVRTVAPQQVVPMKSLQKPLRLVLGIAGIFLLLAILKGPFLAAGFGRLFTPWLAIVYPTNTQIDLGTGDLVIQEGSPALIQIGLSGQVPKSAELALRTGEGRPREINLEVKDGLGTYQIAAASRDFSYRVKAGDARSDWRQVRVIPAPRMAKVAVELDFPDYIERPNETVEALTLTVPEETKVRWQITLDTPIREAKLHRDDAEDLPLEIGADGRTLTLSETASASRGYSFSWVENTHGFSFTSPRYFLQVASDQAPRIELTQPVANINAMLGRPLTLAARMQDDHGIGATRVIYRVNNRPEKTIELPTTKSEGEQTLDWDYRKEITDLQVGDSVSFLVEVTDKYPGEGGAHTARTDTRRITFLSREDYLAEVTKQMERLLTRVRTLYRQQRAAHDLTVSLDPAAESYLATCQLEAIRQEMVREQLVTTADEVQALLDDLAANQVTDALESASLATLRDAMRTIANNHVARAADLLRSQVGATTRDPKPATAAVNQAARELAGLVLLRGIDASREVFARETTMLAKELARIRLRLHQAADQPEALAKGIEEVATWTDQLFDQLTKGTRYDKRPLAVLGLSRRIHDLRKSKLTDALRSAAAQTRGGKSAEANATLYPLIRPLLESEFTMRSGAEYAVIRTLREQLTTLIAAQEKLLTDAQSATDFTALTKRQTELRDALLLTGMSRIPAPRAGLLDITLPPAPPSDERRLRVESLMTEAVKSLQAQSKDEALTRQRDALAALRELDGIINRWSVELAQNTLGVSAQVSDASDRISVLEELETRAIGLIEQIEEVALDEKDPAALTEAVVSLRGELDAFQKELAGEGTTPAKEVLPLLSRVESASKAMSQAVTLLSAKKTEDAIEPQEAAAAALTEARTIAEGQLVQFNLQQQLIGFQQAVSNASNDMADVVGGQNDLIAATQKADEKQLPALLAPQRNLLQCLTDIAPTLDVVAARLDVGTPLVFAASDVEDALLAMEDGDGEDAAEIQETAVESLAKVQGLVSEIAVQTGYVTEIVEFLHNLQSDGSMLAFRQRQLREQNKTQEAFAPQQALAAEAKAYGEALSNVAGRIDFQMLDAKVKEKFVGLDLTFDGMVPVMHMNKALSQLQAGEPATEAMQSAEKAFAAHSDQVNIIIAMLNGLPGIILTKAEPPELHRLIAVLDTASKHRALLRRTHAAAEKDLPSLATAQQALADALLKSNQVEGLQHPMLAKAHEQLTPIVEMLKSSNKAAATAAQLSVDQTVRHFIIEQALILNTAVPPASSSDSDVLTESETDDLYFSETVGEISEFVSGEAPKDKKSEWEILGERNRAALNQNFARELPLEFRATLKNYYERVAK